MGNPKKSTKILNKDMKPTAGVVREPVEIEGSNPWRIGLNIQHMNVQLVADLTGILAVGRSTPNELTPLDIDLRPFDAEELGVSRRHLFIKLKGNDVVVIDNKSSNGTLLNNARLIPGRSYTVKHSDVLMLGAMVIEIKLLINPLT